jgi:mannose-1-phosphate guanylyltransferase/phosphomannomutase
VSPSFQRQLERAYYRDDLRRAFHHDIGELNFPARGRDYYVRGLLDAVDVASIRAADPKLVVDYGWGSATLTAPQVLGRLGGQVLAVNAVLDEEKVVLSTDQTSEHLAHLSRLVRSSGAWLGALIDSPGERLRLVDGSGTVLDPRTALLAYLRLVAMTADAPRVAVPVTTSRVAEQIVRAAGGQVVWTRVSPSALMAAAAEDGIAIAGDEGGGFVFPPFLAAFDGIMALVKLLELLSRAKTDLHRVREELPPAHIAMLDVAVPWEAKGTAMRRVVERLEGSEMVTIDGVKVYRGDDWALVLPHPQEPLIRVWAEADSAENAEELAREFADLVEAMKG